MSYNNIINGEGEISFSLTEPGNYLSHRNSLFEMLIDDFKIFPRGGTYVKNRTGWWKID